MAVEGKIKEILPKGRFGVTLDNEHRIIATAAKRRAFTRIARSLETARTWEMTSCELIKGRIASPQASALA